MGSRAGPVPTTWPAGLRQRRAPTVASIGRTCARSQGKTVPSSTGGADCFAPGRCLLLGYAGDTGAATSVLVTHNAGGRWVKAQLPPGAWSLDSAFCTGPKSCIGVGSTGHVERAAVLASSDGGLSWQVRPAPLGALSLSEVACPVPDRCVVLGPPSDGCRSSARPGRLGWWCIGQAMADGAGHAPPCRTDLG